ncbi:transaldolase [Nocardia sp. NPDC005745]|uniref:transaldolase n=1 Tax=Nocardia sp. NPDC005745 TaxID=3157061 RepID=UPI0033D83BD2
MMQSLEALAAAGVSVWLDDLSRRRLVSGDLERRARIGEVVGVTTNPAIFHKALHDSESYELDMREFAQIGLGASETVRMLTCADVRAACDVLQPVYEETAGQDGRVSIEVDPAWADQPQRTIAEARLLWWLVNRPNVMIKIPATPGGLPAVTACLAEGMSVNVTLIFSLQRYGEVQDAFLAGLEQARANGHDLSRIASVASFFVSRVDTAVDQRLDEIGTEQAKALLGRAAIANSTLAYEKYQHMLRSSRWAPLAEAGARPQRLLWASTSVKNPDYDDTRYVTQLVAPGTVNTMPGQTLAAVADHGEVGGDRLSGGYAQAREVIDALAALGIDIGDVGDQLEREGVVMFQDSWRALIADVEASTARHRSNS